MTLADRFRRLRLRKNRGTAILALVALVFVPLLLLLMAFDAQRSFRSAREMRATVNQSYEQRLQMEQVFSLIQDAETAQRGYVITGQEAFLLPYNYAVTQLGPARQRLRAMQEIDRDGSNVLERAELDALEQMIDTKMAYVAENIGLRRQSRELAEASVLTGRGRQLMDDIRDRVSRMSARESAALAEQLAADAAHTRRTERTALFSFLGLGALLICATIMITRQGLQRQRLLEQAETTAAGLNAIFDSAHDGLVTFNLSGTIQRMNPTGMLMFGYTAEDLVRRDASLLFNMASGENFFLKRLTGDDDSRGGVIREFIARRKNGTTFPAEVSIGRFSVAEGDFVVASFRDLSERRKADRIKSEFISTVSHELRTPLTSIAGSLGLLVGGAAGPMEDRAKRLIGIAYANCQRLVRLINDILDIEKIESGQMPFVLAPMALGDLVRTTVEAMQGLASQLAVTFDIEVEPDTPLVRADADRMSQVITNLLSNAAKVSPPGSTVKVTIGKGEGHRVRMSVKDQGTGVPEDFRERIFSKFAQADSSDTRRMGGTGLGLAITREIIERHGGRIWFDSPPGEGATFCVELQIHTPVRNDQNAPPGEGKVLICEDDPDAAATLAEMMNELGRQTVIVGSVAEAEAMLQTAPDFAAMLLDMRLPDGHGLDLLGRIRANAATRNLPVLIVSGEPPQALDVIDWLQKPVDPSRLKAAVDGLRNGGAGPRPVILHVEDDPDLRQLVAETLSPHFDILAADSVASARELLKLARPHLAILDIALPDGSGLELMPDIRRLQKRVPVIIFSAQNPEDQDLPATIDAVLTKSRASLDTLADMVSRLVPRPAPKERP